MCFYILITTRYPQVVDFNGKGNKYQVNTNNKR